MFCFRKRRRHLPEFSADNGHNLRWLYFNRILRDLNNKLIYFFLPIFLYQLGQEHLLQLTGFDSIKSGFLMIVLYFLLSKPINALALIPFGRLTAKIGHKQALIQSYTLRIVHLIFLYFSVKQPLFLILASTFDALQSALFWPSYHTVLSRQTSKRSMGRSLGILQFLLQLVAAIAPAVAGAIVVTLGFSVLFLVGLWGTILGLITTLFLEFKDDHDVISLKEFFSWLKERRYIRFALAVGSRYVNDVVLFLWPLYLFLLFGSVDKVGYLYTIALFLSLIITVFLTVRLDKIKSRRFFAVSGSLLSIFWIIRTSIVSVWSIAIVDALDKIVSNFHWLFFDVIWYKRGKGSQAHSYFVYSELLQHLTMSLTWIVAASILLVNSVWAALFIIASLSVALSTLMQNKDA